MNLVIFISYLDILSLSVTRLWLLHIQAVQIYSYDNISIHGMALHLPECDTHVT
jgi:hypothetical protein